MFSVAETVTGWPLRREASPFICEQCKSRLENKLKYERRKFRMYFDEFEQLWIFSLSISPCLSHTGDETLNRS